MTERPLDEGESWRIRLFQERRLEDAAPAATKPSRPIIALALSPVGRRG